MNLIVKKTKVLTTYFMKTNIRYKNLILKKKISKIVKFENIIIATIIISSYTNYYNIIWQSDYKFYYYHFNDNQIESIFYMKENIPPNSKILVSNFTWYQDYNLILYLLIYDYQYILWDFGQENSYNKTINYLSQYNISYLLMDLQLIHSTQLNYFFLNTEQFTNIYENNRNSIFKYNGDIS